MTDLTDAELAFKVQKTNDETALCELIGRHSGIYIQMVNRYGKKAISELQYSDLMDDKDYQIYKAAIDYDESRSKFCTHLANRAKYLCLTNREICRENTKIVNFTEEEFCIEDHRQKPDEECASEEIRKKLLNLIDEIKDERTKKIFIERYFSRPNGKTKSWKDVGKTLNLSHQGAIDIHDKILPLLLEKVTNEQITF